jgi:hypothetical protein
VQPFFHRSGGLAPGGAVIRPARIIRVICMMVYEPPIRELGASIGTALMRAGEAARAERDEQEREGDDPR